MSYVFVFHKSPSPSAEWFSRQVLCKIPLFCHLEKISGMFVAGVREGREF
jgi:hypothetical protein